MCSICLDELALSCPQEVAAAAGLSAFSGSVTSVFRVGRLYDRVVCERAAGFDVVPLP